MKNERITYAVMNLLFNCYGVPLFMRGKNNEGIIRIVLSLVTCGIMAYIYQVKGLIECIRILQLTDEQYAEEKAADKQAQ